MRREELFEGIGGLDEELLLRSEERGLYRRNFIVKYGRLAAAIMIAAGAGVSFAAVISGSRIGQNQVIEGRDIASHEIFLTENSVVSGEAEDSRKEEEKTGAEEMAHIDQEEYIDAEKLLLVSSETVNEGARYTCLDIGGHQAIYYKVESADAGKLKAATGGKLDAADSWYRLSGHEDLQYLICNDKDTDPGNGGSDHAYSLWKFGSFQGEGYAYSDVLQMIYHIDSVEDIAEIIVDPATMDNSENGKAIQREIGTIAVLDEAQLKVIYEVISGLTCYGSGHWEMVFSDGDDTPSSMLRQVREGRYLTLVTSRGMKIDTLKYTGISGTFYEYGGIAYTSLTEAQKSAVEEILHITTYEDADEGAGAAGRSDAPVKEEGYHEARTYSAEITGLQSRISEAMLNKELPFVVRSAIYENPDRVHVTVTTYDEELLAQLRSFDPTGKLLEIEYSEQGAVWE